MAETIAKEAARRESPGFLTYVVVYGVALTALYVASARETRRDFTADQERRFHIAALSRPDPAKDASVVTVSLAYVKAKKYDPATVSFLLPEGDIRITASGADLRQVTVLERHRDWQLVEYSYANAHSSVSRYRAFRDRVEPVSYRVTASFGLFLGAVVLLLPAALVAAMVNVAWRRAVRRARAAAS